MIQHNFTGTKADNIQAIVDSCNNAGITNENTIVGILGNAGKESGFLLQRENMNYTQERLPEVWGQFSDTGSHVPAGQGKNHYNALATQYAHQPEQLGDFVYGKWGGYKYRSGGFNGISFISNYKYYGNLIGVDLVANTDMIDDPDVAAKCVVLFAQHGAKNLGIDLDSFTNIDDATYAIVRINSGGGDVHGTEGLNHALNYAKMFSIVPD